YDRAARMPFSATLTCYMLFFGVLYSLLQIRASSEPPAGVVAAAAAVSDPRLPLVNDVHPWVKPGSVRGVTEVVARSVRPTARLDGVDGRKKLHVAGLGETLYTDHLVTVEL